jgi:deleted-in-malignant-brain-tumors protein 1
MLDGQVGCVLRLIKILPSPLHLTATGGCLVLASRSHGAASRAALANLSVGGGLTAGLLASLIGWSTLLTLTLLTLSLLTLTLLTLSLLTLTLLTLTLLTLTLLTLTLLTLTLLTLAARRASAAAGLTSAVARRATWFSTRLAVSVFAL